MWWPRPAASTPQPALHRAGVRAVRRGRAAGRRRSSTGYRPQFYIRTADVVGDVDLGEAARRPARGDGHDDRRAGPGRAAGAGARLRHPRGRPDGRRGHGDAPSRVRPRSAGCVRHLSGAGRRLLSRRRPRCSGRCATTAVTTGVRGGAGGAWAAAGTALVLGGGGLTGIGWEFGILVRARPTRASTSPTPTSSSVPPPVRSSAPSSPPGMLGRRSCTSASSRCPEETARRPVWARPHWPGSPAIALRSAGHGLLRRTHRRHGARRPHRRRGGAARRLVARTLVSHDWPGPPARRHGGGRARRGELTAFDGTSGVRLLDAVSRELRGPRGLAAGDHRRHAGSSTAGCAPAPTPIWPPATTGW